MGHGSARETGWGSGIRGQRSLGCFFFSSFDDESRREGPARVSGNACTVQEAGGGGAEAGTSISSSSARIDGELGLWLGDDGRVMCRNWCGGGEWYRSLRSDDLA